MLRAAYSSKICPGPNDEFMTLMWFTDHEAIVRFAGPDWETAVVPASARAVLSRFDEKAAHYETRVAKEAAPHV